LWPAVIPITSWTTSNGPSDVLNQKNMGVDETTTADAVVYTQDNLTRCVKYEGGKTIVEADAPDAYSYDYTNLRALPEDHFSTMNCTNQRRMIILAV